jgi:hypothetical protein
MSDVSCAVFLCPDPLFPGLGLGPFHGSLSHCLPSSLLYGGEEVADARVFPGQAWDGVCGLYPRSLA